MAQSHSQPGLGQHGPGPLPTIFIKLTEMGPNLHFTHRYSTERIWLPPRPQRSNIASSASVWYRYQARTTTQVQRPNTRALQLYHTYSFYCSARKIFIYPSDASKYQVGDGSGNHRVSQSPIAESVASAHTEYDSSDESDTEQNQSNVERSRAQEDWSELAFTWYPRNGAAVSHATSRGYSGPTLQVRWPDRGQIQELLPNIYHADATRTVQEGQGGMTGEIAILVALVIYSVPRDRVDAALRHCLRANYEPHGLHPGHGCKFDRLVSTGIAR